ncbi:hypothetical protein D3C78_772350 [compost metagenome]
MFSPCLALARDLLLGHRTRTELSIHAHRTPPPAGNPARSRRPAALADPPVRRPWREVRRRAGQGAGAADSVPATEGHRCRRRAAGRGPGARPAHPLRRRFRCRRRHRQQRRRAGAAHARRGLGRLPGAEPLRIRLRPDPGNRRRGAGEASGPAGDRGQRHLQYRRRRRGQGFRAARAGHRPPPAGSGTAGGGRHRQSQSAGLRIPEQGHGRCGRDLLRHARPARASARKRLFRCARHGGAESRGSARSGRPRQRRRRGAAGCQQSHSGAPGLGAHPRRACAAGPACIAGSGRARLPAHHLHRPRLHPRPALECGGSVGRHVPRHRNAAVRRRSAGSRHGGAARFPQSGSQGHRAGHAARGAGPAQGTAGRGHAVRSVPVRCGVAPGRDRHPRLAPEGALPPPDHRLR